MLENIKKIGKNEYSFTRGGENYTCLKEINGDDIKVAVYEKNGKNSIYEYVYGVFETEAFDNTHLDCKTDISKFDDEFLKDIETLTGIKELPTERSIEDSSLNRASYNISENYSKKTEKLEEKYITQKSFSDLKKEVINFYLDKNIKEFNKSENKDFEKFTANVVDDINRAMNFKLLEKPDWFKKEYLIKKTEEFGLTLDKNGGIEEFLDETFEENSYVENRDNFLKEKINETINETIEEIDNIVIDEKGYIKEIEVDIEKLKDIKELEKLEYELFEKLENNQEKRIKIGATDYVLFDLRNEQNIEVMTKNLNYAFTNNEKSNYISKDKVLDFFEKYKEEKGITDVDKYKESIFNQKYIEKYGNVKKEEEIKEVVKEKELDV